MVRPGAEVRVQGLPTQTRISKALARSSQEKGGTEDMSCPTCDHTMHSVSSSTAMLFWCPRCGTLAQKGARVDTQDVPKLVECCRRFRKTIGPDYMSQFASCRDDWKRLGIAESINLPENRKPRAEELGLGADDMAEAIPEKAP